jgi:hypothetical protein
MLAFADSYYYEYALLSTVREPGCHMIQDSVRRTGTRLENTVLASDSPGQ